MYTETPNVPHRNVSNFKVIGQCSMRAGMNAYALARDFYLNKRFSVQSYSTELERFVYYGRPVEHLRTLL